MTFLSEFASAKINLALHVLRRRADGFHEIDSIVAFADVGDELHFELAAAFAISASGPFAHFLPAGEDNLIFRAWQAVAGIAGARGMALPPVSLHLVKNLPIAAGIGGGSADAAAAMRGFLLMAGIEKIDSDIEKTALSLGADVPVCLVSRACRIGGIGERIKPLDDFQPLAAVLVNPGTAVETSAVFLKLGLAAGQEYGAPVANLTSATTWRNDLTSAALALAPAIAQALAALSSQKGLSLAQMSGSGSTCCGLFDSSEAAEEAACRLSAAFPNWWIQQATLR